MPFSRGVDPPPFRLPLHAIFKERKKNRVKPTNDSKYTVFNLSCLSIWYPVVNMKS